MCILYVGPVHLSYYRSSRIISESSKQQLSISSCALPTRKSEPPFQNHRSFHRAMATHRHPEHVVATIKFIQKGFKLIRQSRTPYLDDASDQLKKTLNVATSRLDFYTGKPGDDGDEFIEPFPHTKMHELVNRIQPWESPACPSILPVDGDLDNRGQARDIWNVLQSYLRLNKDDEAPGIISGTDWKIVTPEEDDILFPLLTNSFWKVEKFVDQCDFKKPHISCFLTNGSPLRDMVPYMSELETIVWVTGSRLLDKGYQDHHIVPVTIVSASGPRLRITQGYVHQGQVFVRMTPIIDLEEGERKKWDEFIQTLCWIVGNPIGNTA
ncbi:hypothetical protein GGS23DRAFT_562085 [Durotheca rogersii]|uniref:uncharacterized protein n=1 Tax=Durotheca rogersii TaxID=419775 RepID=UPI00221F96C1|nr:uncharacterized protein GGS23DRAFT_562085 [Durotheca rogersii]KAI5864842.1 hypothetical protein GGS23DRAFT_562085 [Durotheca rogersii]